MKPFRRILAVIDPTRESQGALGRAAALAKLYGADLRLFASCYYSYLTDIAADYGPAAQSFSETTLKTVKDRLEQLAESVRSAGVSISCQAEWDRSRHGSILAAAGQFGADLIVKDTHYHTAISRALFTNTDWSLIRESTVPLWLVKKDQEFPAKPVVIAALDLGEERKNAPSMDGFLLLAGREITRVLRGRLYVFHAFDLLPMLGDAATWAIKPERLPLEKLRSELRLSRAEALDALAGRHGISAEYRLLEAGPVTDTLPGMATQLQASLLVIGAAASNDKALNRIGGTAEAVLDHVPCDLLILRPPVGA
ncbi:MAG: universal stress protein [Woeseia sp.]